jgi:predicted RNA-binding protein YlqC (UPF0109 family)
MKETVEMIVKSFVDDTEAVDVRAIESGSTVRIEVRVAEGDMGKLIGRQGRTVRALRSLLHAASMKANRRFNVEIVEEHGREN